MIFKEISENFISQEGNSEKFIKDVRENLGGR